jgi:hypothetical protein
MTVAGVAWVGCVPPLVLGNKVINDRLLKICAEIHDIIWYSQNICNPSRILDGRQTAAAALSRSLKHILILPDLHGHPNDIIPLFL